MYDINIDRVSKGDISKVEDFLNAFGLNLDKDVEYTIAATRDKEIIGTCSFSGRVIKCFAVKRELQGTGISAKLITHLTNVMFDRGILETFIFTKPYNKEIFEGVGYSEVYSVKEVTLLEGGFASVSKYTRRMFSGSRLGNGEKAGIVMNCNPFTLGHRYLIERASKENKEVVIFIVEENQSIFPFHIRYRLVREGTRDLKNVHVIPGGNYIISSNTFPSYFLKQEDERLNAYTSLDAGIFGKYIAPVFNIKKRYIGTEPSDRVTNKYNEALLSILPEFNINVELVERLSSEGKIVSASQVRRHLASGDLVELEKLVPETTLEFLRSEEGLSIIKRLKE